MAKGRFVTGAVALAMVAVPAALATANATRPAAPRISGPTQTTPGRHTYGFASAGKGIRYRCSLDSASLHACARKVTFTLTAGTHVVRAQAVDKAGRRSAVTRLPVSATAVVPLLSVKTVWQKPTTTTALKIGGLFGIAVGPDGNVYVTDAADDTTQVYDASGNLLRTWGSRGTGPGQFRFEDDPDPADADLPLSAIGVDPRDGSVYVAEPQRIQKFDAAGSYRLGWGQTGTGNGQFTRAVDITIGPNGTVFVLEDRPVRNGRVQEFDPNGAFVTTFGRGQIVDSGGIALDAAGDVYVSDDLGNQIAEFSAAGQLLRRIGTPGGLPGRLNFPTDLAIQGNTLYVADQNNLRVDRFDLATGKPTGYWSTGPATIVGLALDGAGNLFAIDQNGVLARYELSG